MRIARKPPLETRRIASRKRSVSPRLISASSPSSSKNGALKAIANGQPMMPPAANHAIPEAVLSPPLQFMKAAAPSIPVYMVKLEGR